jgi:hypothetical protein
MRGVTGGETVEEDVEGPAWPVDMVVLKSLTSTRFGQVIANYAYIYTSIIYSNTRIVGMPPGNKVASSLGGQC